MTVIQVIFELVPKVDTSNVPRCQLPGLLLLEPGDSMQDEKPSVLSIDRTLPQSIKFMERGEGIVFALCSDQIRGHILRLRP